MPPIRLPRKSNTIAPPVHPFDEAHGVDTSGLIPAGDLITGHPNDDHVTAYYGVAPSILRRLVDLWHDCGLVQVRVQRLSLGGAVVMSGTKTA